MSARYGVPVHGLCMYQQPSTWARDDAQSAMTDIISLSEVT